MAPIRRALPLPDELIENILARVPSPRDLAFASVAHRDFRRIIAGASFPRLYRSLHPPQLLGILVPHGIMPVEAPHPNAHAARALARDADFSYGHLPGSKWRHSDARDGRVHLMRSGLPDDLAVLFPDAIVIVLSDNDHDDVVLPELAVYDPFTRGYMLLPPIPDSLAAASVRVSYNCVDNFRALFVPSGDYEDAHFRVLAWMHNHAMAVVFVYSSLSGTWAAGTAASWDTLGFNVNLHIMRQPEHWLPHHAYGCFYWQLNIDRMEFSAVALPPHYICKSTGCCCCRGW
nr:unnamed protein product [Digitaria exilis]